jgi:hypothetical protein
MDLLLGTVQLAKSYQVNTVGRVPWPLLTTTIDEALDLVAHEGWKSAFLLDRSEPTSHAFVQPILTWPLLDSLATGQSQWAVRVREMENQLEGIQQTIDRIATSSYGLSETEFAAIEDGTVATATIDASEAEEELAISTDLAALTSELIDWACGVLLGRWDIRFATTEKAVPGLPDPFAPLPVCPPGMLQNEQGLPLTERDVQRLNSTNEWHYPLEIQWDGVLVDDPDGANDIVRRVREVLTVIWKGRAEAIEQEACEILEVKDLREFFRKPSLFFANHVKRYFKSRRQAPIYWPLSTASGSYTLWIYYPRINDDLLYTALNKYVKPKIDHTEDQLRRIESNLPSAMGRDGSTLRSSFEQTRLFLEELREFRDELARIAVLPYKPDLNDGVQITASPLWKLFRLPKWRKDLEECWKELEGSEYDWAHLAYSIWPERVRETCKRDRSIAIAHDLESLCEVAASAVKKKQSKKLAIEETVPGSEK